MSISQLFLKLHFRQLVYISAGFKTFKIPVLTVIDLKFFLVSDVSINIRFYYGYIYDLSQLSEDDNIIFL